ALLRLKRVRIGAAPRVDSALPYDSHPHGYCGPGGTQWRHLLSEQATSSHLEQTTCIDVGPVSSYSLCQLYLESSFHEPLSPQSSGGRRRSCDARDTCECLAFVGLHSRSRKRRSEGRRVGTGRRGGRALG